jgi:glycosyltransferase involved in cell wall biosynthesis
MRQTLSVIVITGNEESNIGECLSSVAGWADEIVCVDSGSTDRTVELVRRFTEKIVTRSWTGFAEQKQFALDQATSDWVLSIDADERVSPELKDSIVTALQTVPGVAGFRLPRRSYFLGKWIRSCFWYPDYQLRLFRRTTAHVTPVKVHEGFVVEGDTGTLTGDIIHYSYRNLEDAIRKVNHYSTLAAEDRSACTIVRPYHILLHPIAAFVTDFFSRKGYRDGMYGFLVASLNSFTNLLMYTKMWEMQGRGRGIKN